MRACLLWRYPAAPATFRVVVRLTSPLVRSPMRQHTMLFVSLVAGTVLFASACSDTTQPMPSSDDNVGFEPIQQPDDPVALVRDVRGFGGFFFDRDGAPTVYLRDLSARAQVE